MLEAPAHAVRALARVYYLPQEPRITSGPQIDAWFIDAPFTVNIAN